MDPLHQRLLDYDTCKVANAIERLGLRLKNQGFTRPGLRCVSGGSPRVLGYAVTSRVKCSDPPIKGAHPGYDLGDWWEEIAQRPLPGIAVIEDADPQPGAGAVLSDIHAHVLRALGCRGLVTNGAVRNVDALGAIPFPVFAPFAGVSHAYVHIVATGTPVEIFGLSIAPGDLLYADTHGVLQVPEEALPDIARLLEERARYEARLIVLCESNPSLAALRKVIEES